MLHRHACSALSRFADRAVRCSSSAAWASVAMGPADPILGLTVAYNEDSFEKKVNLGAGAYRDGDGKPFQLRCVRQAERRMQDQNLDMEYAGISGVPAFTKVAQTLLFGEDSPAINEGRVCSAQTISGTGALRVAADFLVRFNPNVKDIYVPSPTWGNHQPIFQDAGLNPVNYSYYRASDCGLDLEGMLADLKKAPAGSTILLHSCAHNPTGVDPTQEQWQQILAVIQEKNHFAFFDTAYQGFASGDCIRDAYAPRLFERAGVPMLSSQSFAKNFGLYGHRTGALHFICSSTEEKARVDSQLKILIRPMYSNPPIHGARVVAEVLQDKELTAMWYEDVKIMSDRIAGMRTALVDALKGHGSTRDWSHVLKQIGMFSFTGLTKDQVNTMIKDYHIYLTGNGRISVCSLTPKNVDYVASAIHAVSK